jgi:hypothetical protein
MALLRWIHLRKLVPLSDLIDGLDAQSPREAPRGPLPAARPAIGPARVSPAAPRDAASGGSTTVKAIEARREGARATQAAAPAGRPPTAATPREPAPAAEARPLDPAAFKNAFLAEVQKAKKFFYGTVIAQAQRIDVEGDRVLIVFAPQHKAMRVQVDPVRATLEELASQVAGRRMTVSAVETAAPPALPSEPAPAPAPGPDRQSQLRQQALADKSVQAMLDVFGAEIKDVEER